MAKVKKNEFNEKVKENLYKEFLSNFNTSFQNLIEDKIDKAFDSGGRLTQKQIAMELEISEQALQNYQAGRIPQYKLLPTIKQYFDVPYSTLFGEIDNKDIKNALIGLNIGLNDQAIKKLKKMQAKAMQDNYETNYEDKFKIFLINCIINDEDLIDKLAYVFSYYLGRVELKNRVKGKLEVRNLKNEHYLINLYRFISSIENRFDTLVKSNIITPQIKEMAFKFIEKYAGQDQEIIREATKK